MPDRMGFTRHTHLPRLPREFYRGTSAVLWTHAMQNRATGWLDTDFHAHFREILLHACHRFHLATPCYVLMPDHWHIVWMGLSDAADQWLATAFLRRHSKPPLPATLQDRPHDHVLREEERRRGAFRAACHYVFENPQRARLCADWRQWPYVGSVVAGFPRLDPRETGFWELFWKIHSKIVGTPSVPVLTRRATDSQSPSARSSLRAAGSGLIQVP